MRYASLLVTLLLLCFAVPAQAAERKDINELIDLVLVKQKHPGKVREWYGHPKIPHLVTGVAFEYGGERYAIFVTLIGLDSKPLPPAKRDIGIITTHKAATGMRVRMRDVGLDGVLDTYRSIKSYDDVEKKDKKPDAAGQQHYDQLIVDLLGFYRLAQ